MCALSTDTTAVFAPLTVRFFPDLGPISRSKVGRTLETTSRLSFNEQIARKMVHGQPISPAGDLHQITLSPTTPARSGFKYDGSPISIKVPDDSASRSNWRSAVVVVIGVLLCTTSIAQVVLASGIRQKVSLRSYFCLRCQGI